MGWQTVPKAHRASPTLEAHRASPTLENHQRATHAKTHRVGPYLRQFFCRAQDLGSTNKDRQANPRIQSFISMQSSVSSKEQHYLTPPIFASSPSFNCLQSLISSHVSYWVDIPVYLLMGRYTKPPNGLARPPNGLAGIFNLSIFDLLGRIRCSQSWITSHVS